MCNRYGNNAPAARLIDLFSEVKIPLRFEGGAVRNIAPREHIRPTEGALIARPVDPADPAGGLARVEARWWLIPFFHKGGIKDWKPLCTNARAESVATTPTFREAFRRRRCLIPATHFFEWTGPKGSKTPWRFTKADSDAFCFAGLWDRALTSDGPVESFAILTTAAGPDCAPYHTRQPVILEHQQWSAWLDLRGQADDLLQAGPAGTIAVSLAPLTQSPPDAP